MKAGGVGFALFAKSQPDTPGKLVAHAYSYEHLELASYELLMRVAQRAGDAETADVARRIRDEEQAMGRALHWRDLTVHRANSNVSRSLERAIVPASHGTDDAQKTGGEKTACETFYVDGRLVKRRIRPRRGEARARRVKGNGSPKRARDTRPVAGRGHPRAGQR